MTRTRLRELGITLGRWPTGLYIAITDVPDVFVGHTTLIYDEPRVARTGVPVIVPRQGNIWLDNAPAAYHAFNGCGEMTGLAWIEESGALHSPIGIEYASMRAGPRCARDVRAGERLFASIHPARCRTRVKICCIKSIEEAEMAVRYGANALGFVSAMPIGPGPISEETIASIIPHVPAGVATFLLTSQLDSSSIIEQQHRTRAHTLQLVDEVSIDTYEILRSALPGVSIVQVIHVTGLEALGQALSDVSPFVDALLLDSGNPNLAVKQLGGTGRVHDWSISRKVCEQAGVPVYLAGGLTPENVAEAIRTVRPFAVDICSGFRTGGDLDEQKLHDFFAQVALT